MLVPVEDPSDPRVDAFVRVRERDLVGRDGRFIAEGQVVLQAALAAGRPLEAVLIDARRAPALSSLIARLPPGVPVYTASQAVLDAIVGFPIHRGILAVGRRPPDPGARALLQGLPARALALALFGVGNHDNMGGLFRNAAAFGAGAVLLGADCCDPLYRKAIRVSVGAALTVPFARLAPDEEPLGLLAEAGFEAVALSPSGREPLSALRRSDRAAVLLGAEGPGLPPALLARVRTVSIPMAPGWDSLNVAVTGGIVLHHLASYP